MSQTSLQSPEILPAEILLDNQIPDKNIIELMGHTDISCTKKFYSRNRKS